MRVTDGPVRVQQKQSNQKFGSIPWLLNRMSLEAMLPRSAAGRFSIAGRCVAGGVMQGGSSLRHLDLRHLDLLTPTNLGRFAAIS